MVMGEGLNLDEALALHYAVENCSREVVKALLELGAADVNFPAGPAGKDAAPCGGRDGVTRHGGGTSRPPCQIPM